MPRKAQTDGKKRKPGLKLSERFSEETRIRIMKVSGLVVCVFAIFTFLSVLSYLFTWQMDQSLLTDPDMMDRGVSVGNWGGKLGYKWSHFLVCRCFGLGSVFIVALLAVVSFRMFFRKTVSGLSGTLLIMLSGAIVSSAILAFISVLSGADNLFGGGLGGDCGAAVISCLANLAGYIVTGFVLAVLVVMWLLYTSGTFSRWFVRAGDHAWDMNPGMPEGDVQDDGDDEEDDGADISRDFIPEEDHDAGEEVTVPVPDETSGTEEEKEEEAGPQDDAHQEGRPAIRIIWKGREKEKTDSLKMDSGTVVAEEPAGPEVPEMEIREGVDLSTDGIKELPRIDTRAELDRYGFPTLDLLDDYSEFRHNVSKEELERNNNKIRTTLLDYKIQVEKVVACKGPTVTLYKVTPAPGVKISAIKNLENDIAMALGAKGVRVVKLTDSVGIEVANERPSIVPLKSCLNDDAFRENKFELPVAIGYAITQNVKVFDLAEAPHLLVAGATKQGKSVGLNVIITSLLYAKHPSELKFVFIDPKMVEFNAYSKLLKHYLAVLPTAANEQDEMAGAIVKNPKQAETILQSLCKEMDERYKLMSVTSANNVKLYNEKYRDRHLNPNDGHRFLPYIVVVIDEYADLIMSVSSGSEAKTQARNITTSIIRLAQKGRAAGIHVIIATQRPSVDVVTGIIKTNFPMRIAFRTSTRVDSNTILDTPGAEKLIGKGDMLYYAGVEIERVQCAMISMDEIYRVTDYIGAQTGYRQCYNTPYYLPEPDSAGQENAPGEVDMQNLDENFKDAAEYVVRRQKGSTSDLQRSLGMGYARAGRVMDQLEAAGIVGPQEGSKPRQVLVADLDELQGILDAYMNS